MQVATIIPLTKSIFSNPLTYFSSKHIEVGDTVVIELRKKDVYGLVIHIEAGSQVKTMIKEADYALKRVKKVLPYSLFPPELCVALSKTAHFYATPLGALFYQFIPQAVLDNPDISKPRKEVIKKVEEKSADKDTGKNTQENSQNDSEENAKQDAEQKTDAKSVSNFTSGSERRFESYLIQESEDARISHYKNSIREDRAQKKSVLLVCPTQAEVRLMQKNLSKGIEDHVFSLHSGLTKKKQQEQWELIIQHPSPVLIIATKSFIGIPRPDLGTIIIEKESSTSYNSFVRPYFNARFTIEAYAKEHNIRLIIGDTLLRAELLVRFDQGDFNEFTPMKFRVVSDAKPQIIDMKKTAQNAGDSFSVFSNDVQKLIERNKDHGERLLLLVARKGLAPTVTCGDCAAIVTCNNCENAVVLHGADATKNDNYFSCHVCGHKRSAGELCSHCSSWRLKELGIGTEKVEQSLHELNDEITTHVLSGDTAKTNAQARKIVTEFMDNPGSILVSTEMALPYITEPIENVAIITLDSLFSIPDFTIRERILRSLLIANQKAQHQFLIQTRKADDRIFEYLRQGNLSDFFRTEFQERAQFHYPPFTLFIRFTLSGNRGAVLKAYEDLNAHVAPHTVETYEALRRVDNAPFTMHGIIRLKRTDWIDASLHRKITALPPEWKVIIDCESLL